MTSAAWKGFQQLVSYWRRILATSPSDVGFGIVVVFNLGLDIGKGTPVLHDTME